MSSGYIRGDGATVAIVDSGIYTSHPDLSGNIVNDDLNQDPGGESHGTQVAGIAAGNLDRNRSVGVAPEAKIIPIALLANDTFDSGEFSRAYSHAQAHNAFVVNNSWGPGAQGLAVEFPTDIRVGSYTIQANRAYLIRVPDAFNTDLSYRHPYFPGIGNMLVVFGAGNDGWNSESGEIEVIASNATVTVPLSNYNFNTLTIVGFDDDPDDGRYSPYNTPRTLTLNENHSNAYNLYPIRHNPGFRNQWINVVAVDAADNIASFSNGCGETQAVCVAAPGVNVRTSSGSSGTANASGTSMAAPHVTGLAALLKGAFPNLTASQAQNIILSTADGLGSCAGVDISVYCTDDVYGHGVINVQNAFTPYGDLFGGGVSLSQTAIDSSRIVLSRSFGDAPWRETNTNIGALDQYGRVFYANLDLNRGVVITKPETTEDNAANESDGEHELAISGAAVHRVIAPPLHTTENRFYSNRAFDTVNRRYGQYAHRSDNFNFFQQSYGGYVAYGGEYFADSKNTFAWQHHHGDPTALPNAARFNGFYKPAFVSEARSNLQYTHRGKNADIAWLAESGSNTRQLATRLRWGGNTQWQAFAEGGVVYENDTVLGGRYSGIYTTADAATQYRRFGFHYRFAGNNSGKNFASDDKEETAAPALRLFADYVRAKTTAGKTGGIVRAYHSAADSFSFGLDYDGWTFSYTRPMAVTDGVWQWEYIDGYDENGDYRTARKNLDLSAQRREQIFSLHYVGTAQTANTHLHYSFGADAVQNAAAKNFRGNMLNLSTAVKIRF